LSKKSSSTSEKNTGPDFRNIASSEAAAAAFPVRMKDEFRVYISPDAHKRMQAHAAVSDEVELCGVLIGDVLRDDQGCFLNISAIIEGEGANNYGSQVTFTHQTWSHINETKDKEYPQHKIVGWYHTHPGFGVFLSTMDSFIQENFFNQPYQVAIVLETKEKVEGCFAWMNGKATPLRRYWVGNEEISLAGGQVEPVRPSALVASPRIDGKGADSKPETQQRPSSFASLLIMLLGGFLCGWLFAGMTAKVQTAEAVATEIYSILSFASLNTAASADFNDLHQRLEKLQSQMEPMPDKASKEMEELLQITKTLEKEYGKRKFDFRRNLKKRLETEMHLGQRLASMQRRQDKIQNQIDLLFLDMYFLRLKDLVGEEGEVDMEKMEESKKRVLKAWLDQLLGLAPQMKKDIQKAFPGLIEYYYPERNKEGSGKGKE